MDPATIMALVSAGTQSIKGMYDMFAGPAKTKKIQSQRKGFETPEQVYDIVGMSQYLAQNGFDAFTLQYLNNEIDRSTSSSLDAMKRMGADPNLVGDVLDKSIISKMKVGAENATMQMSNYNRLIDSLKLLASNKEAEWASRDNMIKDKLQQAAGQTGQGFQNFMGGLNTGVNAMAMQQQSNLYSDQIDMFEKMFGTKSEKLVTGTGAAVTPFYLDADSPFPG